MASRVRLLKIDQWLRNWEAAKWAPEDDLPRPPDHFYIGSIPITLLRELCGVSRRQVAERKRGNPAPGYQRAHEMDRSNKIGRYIRFGYPLSTSAGLEPKEHRDLIHPGWLPTSIIVNIVSPGEQRRRGGRTVSLDSARALKIIKDEHGIFLAVPDQPRFDRAELEPLEIIDGQHRIFSIEADEELDGKFDVPVVFFQGLSQAWQAYLFWVINVEPKKINPSLAFDLYPELRSQSWLERGEGIKIYQEHRAQEVTEALWRFEKSVWRDRIELLGNRIEGHVSNAAFIRSLMATFVRRWGKEDRVGGLFGSLDRDGKERVLKWNRAQQIAFLITTWNELAEATANSQSAWAVSCRKSFAKLPLAQREKINPHGLDPAFAGPHTLLATDQGVRAISFLFNAVCQVSYSDIGLEQWEIEGETESVTSDAEIDACIESLKRQKSILAFIRHFAAACVQGPFDWRTSSEPGLAAGEREQALQQAVYRGSSGYRALQQNLLTHLLESRDPLVRDTVRQVIGLAGFA